MSDTHLSANRLWQRLWSASPAVAASVTDRDSAETIGAARAGGLDVAELRIDHFADQVAERVLEVAARCTPTPTIATIRSAQEGGAWGGTDAQRAAVFDAVVGGVDGIDIEMSSDALYGSVVARARAAGTVVVVSAHDFDGVPSLDALRDLAARARGVGADLVKVAATPRDADELARLASFTIAEADRGVIVVAMGPWGPLSRLAFPALGSRLTFASMGGPGAPGQLPLDETVALLHRLVPTRSTVAAAAHDIATVADEAEADADADGGR